MRALNVFNHQGMGIFQVKTSGLGQKKTFIAGADKNRTCKNRNAGS
jgi:hypothetical protein